MLRKVRLGDEILREHWFVYVETEELKSPSICTPAECLWQRVCQ
jgi:hypothetical protein